MSLQSLKKVFEEDKIGKIPLRLLDKHSRSRTLIDQVAKSYDYHPYYRRNSHKIHYYVQSDWLNVED